MTLFFVTALMCVLFASCLVFAESSVYSVTDFTDIYPTGVYVRPSVDGYDAMVSPFTSIPYAFWWFFVTVTTVGYGDDVATTTAGRFVSMVTFYLGIILLALPLTIVGQSFNKFYPSWVQGFQNPSQTAVISIDSPSGSREVQGSHPEAEEKVDQSASPSPVFAGNTSLKTSPDKICGCGQAHTEDTQSCRKCNLRQVATHKSGGDVEEHEAASASLPPMPRLRVEDL